MRRKNIFEQSILVQKTVPFYQRQKSSPQPSFLTTYTDLKLIQIKRAVEQTIAVAVSNNKRIRELQNQITALKEKRQKIPHDTTSAYEVYKALTRSGRATSYYEAESVSLGLDAEYVATVHNIGLLSNELCREVKKVKKDVLKQMLGEKVDDSPKLEKKRGLPAVATKKYSICVRLHALEDDDPDPEVLGLFEEDQAQWEANGNGKRGNGRLKAQMASREMVQAGMRTVKIYASSRKDKAKGEIVVWRAEDEAGEKTEFEGVST